MNDVLAIGSRKADLDNNADDFRLPEVIELRLLCAIGERMLVGVQSGECVGGVERNGCDVRTALGLRKSDGIFPEEIGEYVVVVLTEEISFADGGVGQRCIEGAGRGGQQKKRN